MIKDEYKVAMVSFENQRAGGYNVITKDGGNVQPWHIPVLEQFVEDMKAKLAGTPVDETEEDYDDLC